MVWCGKHFILVSLLVTLWAGAAECTLRGRAVFSLDENRAAIKLSCSLLAACWRLITVFLQGRKLRL